MKTRVPIRAPDDAAGDPASSRHVAFEDGCQKHGWMRFVGTREALMSRGLITRDTELPKRSRGCVRRAGETVSMLNSGRFRLTIESSLAGYRDRAFRTFMNAVIARPSKRRGASGGDDRS
jgi:hypothetical protein